MYWGPEKTFANQVISKGNKSKHAVADPDLELRGGGGGWVASFDLLALLALLSSVISSFFTHNKGGLP